jgi:uncharacterized membrane protein YbhN (UPF0104 family)
MPPAGPGRIPFFVPRGPLRFASVSCMAIFNRRNAVVGWIVLKAGKHAVKKKAAEATPTAQTAAAAGGTAALLGALLFWRKKHSGDDE